MVEFVYRNKGGSEMENIDLFFNIGIPALIFFVLMLTAGVIILVVSVVKTSKGKKRIGGIITGS